MGRPRPAGCPKDPLFFKPSNASPRFNGVVSHGFLNTFKKDILQYDCKAVQLSLRRFPQQKETHALSHVRNREFAQGRWARVFYKNNGVEKIVAADTFRSSMAK
jgi:hypothetical protein